MPAKVISDLIESVLCAREQGLAADAAQALVRDLYAEPLTDPDYGISLSRIAEIRAAASA